jgi:acyl-[acyl-carrier-protein]-phospholipid O-acyltransferase/long-chain-fatty-acid--[acyl-carrier-protein] ligase
MLPFRRGFERIMKDVDAPIIPVCLDGLWGSIFSFEKGRFFWKLPRRIPFPVTVSFGQPMPPSATPAEVRQAVQELSAKAWPFRKDRMRTLHRAFVDTARKIPRTFAMADARTAPIRFGTALTRTIFLGRRLAKVWAGQDMVGILLPPSVGGALVNLAALLGGRVPVNLNYTASDEILASCAQQCGIQTVVTSKAFLDKLKLKVPGKAVMLEDLAQNPTITEKLTAWLMTWFLPARAIEKALGAQKPTTLDDLATVIFSSGSTGDPKGVMLTHYNIGSNIEQLEQTFALTPRDRFMGILPFFHSFGFTGTLALPAVTGVGAIYHVSPLDAAMIGELTRKHAASFLMATPTFLQMYLRGVAPEDFGSLQFVMAGAEKLPERVAAAFEEKFGIRPQEGYGSTECSPAVTVNTRDFRSAGFRQVGSKRGKIGHPLPGMSVRVVDPATLQPLSINEPGLLMVRGPNVMKGYLGRPEKTAEVIRDGWYITGDIATMDEDGFLAITDRLSRFSKIGGEMVPHIKVEEKLHELAAVTELTFVVTGIPDEKKGERLVVLHTFAETKLKETLEKLSKSDLPNLWIPRPNQFFRVDSIPHLGTGKLDLRRIREMAVQLSSLN